MKIFCKNKKSFDILKKTIKILSRDLNHIASTKKNAKKETINVAGLSTGFFFINILIIK